MRTVKIDIPLRIKVSSKKDFILNLNNYRNTHFQILNKAKKNYKDLIINKLTGLNIKDKFNRVEIEYILYPKSHRLTDLDNVISIIQKFFQDAIVEMGLIEDDNYKFIVKNIQRFGKVDKVFPRVEVVIKEVGI